MSRRLAARQLVSRLLQAKEAAGKTYSQIAAETGLTNVCIAQIFNGHAPLPDLSAAAALRSSVPALTDDMIDALLRPPFDLHYRSDLINEPTIYRLHEAVMHNGQSISEIIGEEFGHGVYFDDVQAENDTGEIIPEGFHDGVLSATDLYCSVDKVRGVHGEDRVVVTIDGEYVPFDEEQARESRKV